MTANNTARAIPDTMTAVNIDETAATTAGVRGPEVLVPQTVSTPKPGPGQVLVQVVAAGVNRPDVLQRRGSYPAAKGHSLTPGLEMAGHVVAIGPEVERWKVGDAVMALLNGGGYATYAIAEAGACLAVPANLSLTEAAGIPETFFTVWHNLFERGRLATGDWVLIHGGSSGIGVTAIQLAKAFGAKVIITAGSDDKCAACRQLGADVAVNYATQDYVEVVKAATSGHGCDVILDMVGADYVERNIRCAAEDGRIVNIAFQKGATVTVDLQRAMMKRLTLTGSTLRPRTNAVKAGIAEGLRQHVLPLLADGRIKVIIDQTFPLTDAAQAHARMESSQHIGKIMLVV
jgi:NADPH:quinone reductase